jgi:hypothetical protein
MSIPLQPSEHEVLQVEEPSLTAIPVIVAAVDVPVRVQRLPMKTMTARTFTLSNTNEILILRADHYRDRTTIMADGYPIRVATTSNNTLTTPYSGLWPPGIPLVLDSCTTIRVSASDVTVYLTVISESWATSE